MLFSRATLGFVLMGCISNQVIEALEYLIKLSVSSLLVNVLSFWGFYIINTVRVANIKGSYLIVYSSFD